jgi:hypothetical protein
MCFYKRERFVSGNSHIGTNIKLIRQIKNLKTDIYHVFQNSFNLTYYFM